MCKSAFQKTVRFASLLIVLFASAVSTLAQTTPANSPPKVEVTTEQAGNDEKAEEVVRRAIAAQGGSAYLAVKTIIGRGYYSPFDKGVALPPQTFVDYLVFPDRERTEFRGARGRYIQTNEGERGWVYEQQTRSLVDMTPEQVANFKLAMRTSVDNLLRGWWRKEGARLTYLGRREAGLAKRNEAVRVTYPDGLIVEYEIGARDGLLAKTFYKRKSAEGEEIAVEERYASYQTINGLTVPFIIDQYRGGMQASRINYDSIQFNATIPDTLFAKPANIKAIK